MRPIHETDTPRLRWAPVGRAQRHYELRSNDALYATLKWVKDRVVGDVAGASWYIDRRPGSTPTVRVLATGHPTVVAEFRAGTNWEGIVQLESAATYEWRSGNRRRTEWEFVAADGRPVLGLASEANLLQAMGRVELKEEAVRSADMPVLVVLAWYLFLQVSGTSVV